MTGPQPDWVLVDLGSRPDLADQVDQLISSNLPPFMSWESPGNWRWHRLYDEYPTLQVCALDPAGRLLGAVNGVPLRWDGSVADLPAGYDDVMVGVVDENLGRSPTALCLLSISVVADLRGRGLPAGLLAEMRRRSGRSGWRSIVIPLRPTGKPRYPLISIDEYAGWRRADGTVFDPWLRTHVAAGASVLGGAPRSLIINQPATRWAEATGMPMPGPGRYVVPGALAPVEVDDVGTGTYTEPNIWIRHAVDQS